MKRTLLTMFALLAVLTVTTLHSTVLAGSTKTISAPVTVNPAAAPGSEELARARSATAKYHTVEAAEADGYISINFCEPGEGCHWLNPSYVDGTFDVEHPEILLYAPGENGLRLVAVEYVAPIPLLPGGAPEGFTGVEDEWRQDTEGAGLWELTVWLWLHNPNGMFEQHNPRVP